MSAPTFSPAQTLANRPLIAAGCIVTGMAALSFVDQFIGELKKEAGLWQFLFVRTWLMIGALWLFANLRGISMRPVSIRALGVRSVSMTLGMVIYFGALGYMPVAKAAAGLFTSPIFVLLISVFFLRQRVGPWRIIAVAIGFLGIVMVLTPGSGALLLNPMLLGELPGTSSTGVATWIGFIPALAGLFYGLAVVATRQWCSRESTMALLVSNLGTMGIFSGLMLLVVTFVPGIGVADSFLMRPWTAPTGDFWFWTMVQAVGSLTGVVLLTKGYQLGEASYVSVFEYSILIFSALFSYLILDEILESGAIVGIALIILAGCTIVLRAGRL